MDQWRGSLRRREDGRSVLGEGAVGERTARSVAPSSAGGTGERSAVGPGSPDRQASSLAELRPALSSRRALRRAILLHEILGSPKALQRPAGEISRRPDGRSPLVNGRRRDHVGQTDDRPGSGLHEGDAPSGLGESPHVPAGPSGEARRRERDNPSIVGSVYRALNSSANAVRRLFGRVSFGS